MTLYSNPDASPGAPGCHCICHRTSGVKHIVPCCYPNMDHIKNDELFEKLCEKENSSHVSDCKKGD